MASTNFVFGPGHDTSRDWKPGDTLPAIEQSSGYQNPYEVLKSGGNPFATPAPQGLPGQTAATNFSAAPDLRSLSDLINSINRDAQTKANEARVPGSGAVEQQLLKNTGDLSRGQLPQDVINQIQQQSAERGVSTGNSDYLRSLGLTSLQAQQMAQQNLSAADARNPGAPIFDPTHLILTPYQAGTLNNESNRTSLDWWNALNNRRGVGGGGGYPSSSGGASSQPDMSWFSRLINQVNAGANPAAPTSSFGGGGTTYNPITEQDLFDTGFGDPTPIFDIPSGYDPFGGYA
jgi:hypothetical protein